MRRNRDLRERASVLIAVLWSLVLLAIVVVSTLHASLIETRLVQNHGDRVQARYLALAAIEKAKALIYRESSRLENGGVPDPSSLLDNPAELRDVSLAGGVFRVVRPEGRTGELRYGLTDEERYLDANVASPEELGRLPGITPPVAAAFVDWRDSDSEASLQGAEAEVYAALRPPYRIRNAPFETLDEILAVRGVTSRLLRGEDENGNGTLDPEEDDGTASPPLDNRDGQLDRGWSEWLTVHAGVRNVSARGRRRVDVTQASAEDLAEVDGLSSDLAAAIVAWREARRLESIADLLDVRRIVPGGQGPGRGGAPTPRPEDGALPLGGESMNASPSSGNGEAQVAGDPLISKELLRSIADELTMASARWLPGVVNVNTASQEVLACLPGIEDSSRAAAVVGERSRRGRFESIIDLLDVPGIDREAFKKLAPRITIRSETFCVHAEGTMPATGATQRVEAVLRFDGYEFVTLAFRDL